MKKLIIIAASASIALFSCNKEEVGLNNKDVNTAINNGIDYAAFQEALSEYIDENGSNLYEGQEIQPSWFEWEYGTPFDTIGDGIKDSRVKRKTFKAFGKTIWRSKVVEIEYNPNGFN